MENHVCSSRVSFVENAVLLLANSLLFRNWLSTHFRSARRKFTSWVATGTHYDHAALTSAMQIVMPSMLTAGTRLKSFWTKLDMPMTPTFDGLLPKLVDICTWSQVFLGKDNIQHQHHYTSLCPQIGYNSCHPCDGLSSLPV
jgi:hypothetical protein